MNEKSAMHWARDRDSQKSALLAISEPSTGTSLTEFFQTQTQIWNLTFVAKVFSFHLRPSTSPYRRYSLSLSISPDDDPHRQPYDSHSIPSHVVIPALSKDKKYNTILLIDSVLRERQLSCPNAPLCEETVKETQGKTQLLFEAACSSTCRLASAVQLRCSLGRSTRAYMCRDRHKPHTLHTLRCPGRAAPLVSAFPKNFPSVCGAQHRSSRLGNCRHDKHGRHCSRRPSNRRQDKNGRLQERHACQASHSAETQHTQTQGSSFKVLHRRFSSSLMEATYTTRVP